MNDALVGTWIKLANVVVALTYVIIQQYSANFQRNILHLSGTLEDFPQKGLKSKVPFLLLCLHLILNVVIVIHVCIVKFKNRNNTPVIQINIPNPSQAPANNPPIAINNQAYNNDIVCFSIHLSVMFSIFTLMAPFVMVVHFDLMPTLADCFKLTDQDFFALYYIIKGFIQAFIIGFLTPFLLMLSSSELRPFLCKSLSCKHCINNQIIDVYN